MKVNSLPTGCVLREKERFAVHPQTAIHFWAGLVEGLSFC